MSSRGRAMSEEQDKQDVSDKRKEVCNHIIQMLFAYGITKFNFRGKKSKFKLDVIY